MTDIEIYGRLGAPLSADALDAATKLHALCFERAWSADEIESLATGFGGFLVLGNDGFALGRLIAPEVELLTICVRPDTRGHGLGKMLQESFCNFAYENGAEEAFLEVDIKNTAAISLYRKSNWKSVHIRKDYYLYANGERSDATIMRKKIS